MRDKTPYDKLYELFPDIFWPRISYKEWAAQHPAEDGEYQTPFDQRGFEVNAGWYHIVYNLAAKLHRWNQLHPDVPVRCHQCKEKFGGLRFYSNAAWKSTPGSWITAAERASYHTCEVCGEYGRSGGDGWYVTLCHSCREARDEARRRANEEWEAKERARRSTSGSGSTSPASTPTGTSS